jgi:hypothetical protein
MKLWPLLLLLVCLSGIWACKKNSSTSTPSISFINFTRDTVHGGSYKDTAFLNFGFKDGDGDLGNDPTTGQYDVFLHDSRNTSFGNPYPVLRFFFPPIPGEALDPYTGAIEGRGTVALRAIYITPRQDTLHKLHSDTVVYKMWVVDKAQHVSDTITTTPLIIIP